LRGLQTKQVLTETCSDNNKFHLDKTTISWDISSLATIEYRSILSPILAGRNAMQLLEFTAKTTDITYAAFEYDFFDAEKGIS